ncbi:MAG: DUF3179 domain-containing protein [candidate division NC10 bacterium]|nr:DUF3179 domain-containing protein [candidate division NC10 bacterium]
MRGRRNRIVGALVVWLAWALGVGSAPGGRASDITDIVSDSPIITVLPKDAIPAIDNPKFVSATEGDRVMKPEEPVLGVSNGHEAKAYSLWQLNHHEIVNDRIGTLPVAVTW